MGGLGWEKGTDLPGPRWPVAELDLEPGDLIPSHGSDVIPPSWFSRMLQQRTPLLRQAMSSSPFVFPSPDKLNAKKC